MNLRSIKNFPDVLLDHMLDMVVSLTFDLSGPPKAGPLEERVRPHYFAGSEQGFTAGFSGGCVEPLGVAGQLG